MRLFTIMLATLALGPTAAAQLQLTPVDQGVDDADPHAVSFRTMPHDLRLPASFERLYKVPDRDDLLMRVDGGVYAVFPRSLYAQTRIGPLPLIPNDTVFHIDPATVEALAKLENDPVATRGAARRVDRSATASRQVDRAIRTEVALTEGPPAPPAVRTPRYANPVTIANDARYRRERLRALVQRADAARRDQGES